MSNETTHTRHAHDDPGTLSEAILGAIAEHTGEDLSKSDFLLFDIINPDSLNTLFREDADAEAAVRFHAGDVTVFLWGDGPVEIEVAARDGAMTGALQETN